MRETERDRQKEREGEGDRGRKRKRDVHVAKNDKRSAQILLTLGVPFVSDSHRVAGHTHCLWAESVGKKGRILDTGDQPTLCTYGEEGQREWADAQVERMFR